MGAIDSQVYLIVFLIDRQPLYSSTTLMLSHELCHTIINRWYAFVVGTPLYPPLIAPS